MKRVLLIFLIFGFLAGASGCRIKTESYFYPSKPQLAGDYFIVFIILDGIRWQEIFFGTNYAPAAYRDKAQTGRQLIPFLTKSFMENPLALTLGGNRECEVNNPYNMSMPGYADILAGRRQENVTSHYFRGLIRFPTIFDTLIFEEGYSLDEFAFFSSFQHFERVVSQRWPPIFHVDTRSDGLQKLWPSARYDVNTMIALEAYLKQRIRPPRFLFVSFNDADEWAHQMSYENYLKALTLQDGFVAKLYDFYEQTENNKKTLWIIASDHGRGSGERYYDHQFSPESKYFWVMIQGPAEIMQSSALAHLKQDCDQISLGQLSHAVFNGKIRYFFADE